MFLYYEHTQALHICLFIFLLPHSLACGILIPRPENEPMTPELGAWSLSHWTAWKTQALHI